MDHLTALFQEIWRQGEVPQDFKDATIVHLYKRKGNRQVCDNHRGISLLNIAGKIFARILLNRLNNHLEQGLLPESQCGFRCHRGTTDMIFAARQLQEKCQEMRTHLYSTFVDLTKAFDTVNREGLWKIMQKFDCPERFTQMVRQLHDGMMARVTDNGAVSEAFAVTNGVKQGCVLAPTLFNLMFSAMLMDAYRDERPGIRIAYRTDGHLLNQRRMHFKSRGVWWNAKARIRPSHPPAASLVSGLLDSVLTPGSGGGGGESVGCQRKFRTRIGLVRHLWSQCNNSPTIPTATSSTAPAPIPTESTMITIIITTTVVVHRHLHNPYQNLRGDDDNHHSPDLTAEQSALNGPPTTTQLPAMWTPSQPVLI
nr:unnamed protein product [Spirometra erinaceieuropaei]